MKGLSLRRATLEMFVIVGSILLAFSLDAGWDAHQRQAEADDLMIDLVAEFEEAAAELERTVARNEEVIAAATEVLAALTRSPGNTEVAASILAKLILVPTTDPRRGNLDALVASGDLGLVNPRHLRGSLANWPAALRDLQEEELDARVFVQTILIPFLANAVEIQPIFAWRLAATPSHRAVTDANGTELSDDPMIRLPSNRQFSSLVATRRYFSQFTVSNAGTVQEDLETILLALKDAVAN